MATVRRASTACLLLFLARSRNKSVAKRSNWEEGLRYTLLIVDFSGGFVLQNQFKPVESIIFCPYTSRSE